MALDRHDPPGFSDFPMVQAHDDFRHIPFRFSPPVRFGEKYADELAASERISLWLNANLVDLRLSEDGTAVTAAVFRGYAPEDPGFTVRARLYCLCTGGIENARILLNARSQEPQGIGNRHDLVGRYFSDHPTFTLADVIFEKPMPARMAFYAPTPRFMDEHAILNIGLRLNADPLPPPLSLRAALWHSLACAASVHRTACRAGAGPPGALRPGRSRAPTGRAGTAPPLTGIIEAACEQALDPDSRVTLGPATDVFGLHEVALDWRLGALDAHTMRTAVTAFGMHLAEQGIGRIRVSDWLLADPAQFPRVGEHRADRTASHGHHPHGRRSAPGRRRPRLPGARDRQFLHRRLQRVRYRRPCKPDLYYRAAGAAAGRPSGRGAAARADAGHRDAAGGAAAGLPAVPSLSN